MNVGLPKLRDVLLILLAVVNVFQLPASGLSDEVVIDERATSGIELGDFKCLPCSEQVTRALALALMDAENKGEVSAGKLWQFFHDQGVDSLDRLTLCLDIDPVDGQSTFDLSSIQLQIEDPHRKGQYLTEVSLGDNSLLVPGYRTSAYKPEAKLEVDLGYDFMERFSATSTEMIKLDYSSNSELARQPKFSIEGTGNVLTRLNVALLIGFGLFWIVVFIFLYRLTSPEENKNASAVGVSVNRNSQRSSSVLN